VSAAKGAKKRAEELRRLIAHHDRAYYVLDEPRSPTLSTTTSSGAPGNRGGASRAAHPGFADPAGRRRPLDKFNRVEHAEPMLSLANARNEDELRAWAKRVERNLERLDIEGSEIRYVTEPKVDGLAISLTYENGCWFAAPPAATGGSGRR
jgi:DNA ligase (NAD+)